MLPAHEGFEADDHVVLGADHRLIVQLELPFLERDTQVLEQDCAFLLLVLEIRGVEPEGAASAVLGGIER